MSRALAVEDRRAGDAYGTPPELARAICAVVARRMRRSPPAEVIEPSAGSGPFVRAAREAWPTAHVTAVEVDERFGVDLTAAGAHRVLIDAWPSLARFIANGQTDAGARRLVIGNPPYRHAEEHIVAALEFLREGDELAFLLRLNLLGSRQRVAFWRTTPLAAVYPIVPRPSFTGGGTDATEYGLFCWRKGHRGGARLGRHIVWRGVGA